MAFDRCAAALGLVLAAPVMAGVAIALLVEGKGPIIFSQERPGRYARLFRIYKFRTMRPGREPDGQRLTPLGIWLRRTSLDELPQLWNVLRGELSLVGPRPLLLQYLPFYSADEARRHEVQPGITGLAQINGRNAISWSEKFALDLWYVDHWSLCLDLRIIVRTVRSVWSRKGVALAGSPGMGLFIGTQQERPRV
jgi:lipopolysaccharide/colanic/teichoic acid biosynthesis glycosyltransferase